MSSHVNLVLCSARFTSHGIYPDGTDIYKRRSDGGFAVVIRYHEHSGGGYYYCVLPTHPVSLAEQHPDLAERCRGPDTVHVSQFTEAC